MSTIKKGGAAVLTDKQSAASSCVSHDSDACQSKPQHRPEKGIQDEDASYPSTKYPIRELVWLSAPLIGAHAGNQLIGLVDTAIVGSYSEVAQGAAGLGHNLFFAVAVLGMGIMMSLEPLISQAIGAKQLGRSRSLLWQGVWLASIVGVLLSLLVAMTPLLLPLFGIDEETSRETRTFLFSRIPGLWPLLLSSAVRGYLQATGRASAMVWSMLIGNVTNVILASLFVLGSARVLGYFSPSLAHLDFIPPLGVMGAAFSASLCTLFQLVYLVSVVRRSPVEEPFSRRFDRKEIVSSLRVGVPIGLQLLAEVGAFSLAGLLAAKFGKVPLAAHQIALSWASFTFSMALGISSAGAVLVGRAVGEQNTIKARMAGITALIAGGAAMSVSALVFLLFPGPLASMLSDNEAVIASTVSLLGVAVVFQVFDGIQVVGAGVLRGAGDTRSTFVVNLVGHYFIGLPLGVALGFLTNLKMIGLWWGLCAGLVTVGVLLFWRFLRISSKHIERL
jgi:MATE family multidrug resistance protein